MKKYFILLGIFVIIIFAMAQQNCGNAPVPFIIGPIDGEAYPDIRPVHFEGYAYDSEDGMLQDDDLGWKLPEPYNVYVPGAKHDVKFPVGEFKVEFFATDSSGNVTKVPISFSVFHATDNDKDGYCIEVQCGEIDCDDNNPNINPGVEFDGCDQIDNDCDGELDENCCIDNDGDSYSQASPEGEDCGPVDCDDDDALVNPGVRFDGCDRIDNDCDGIIDEDCCTDKDGDGYAIEGGICGPVDCNDNNKLIYPGATEICDGKDNDCDRAVDENVMHSCMNYATCQTYMTCEACPSVPTEICDGKDNDCDGFVDEFFDLLGETCTVGMGACQRTGVVQCKPDGSGVQCSKTPGTPVNEVCGDLIDNDCDGQTDEGCCTDNDGDGYASQGGVCGPIDCNDNNANIKPGATEVCDYVDNNCNGTVDENCDAGNYQYSGDFVITQDTVTPTQSFTASVTVIGAAISYGGQYDMKVTASVKIGSTTLNPWGDSTKPVTANVNDGNWPKVYNITTTYPANTPITVKGTSWYHKNCSTNCNLNTQWQVYMTQDAATPNNQNIITLRNNDPLPSYAPYLNQTSIKTFLAPYIDSNTGKIKLQSNQAIYLFELGTTSTSSAAFDMQDLVILVTFFN